MNSIEENIENETNIGDGVNKRKNSFISKIIRCPYMLILILAVGIYAQTLFFGITGLDDDFYFPEENPGITAHLTGMKDAVLKSYLDLTFYRPLINLTFLFNMRAGGDSPFIFHLTNLIIHAFTCCLVFLLMQKLKYKKSTSLIAASFFAVHPLLTNAVVWLVGRCDMLAAMFGILAFIFFILYMEKNKLIYLFLHGASLILAVFSKELALSMPVITAIYWLLYHRKSKPGKSRILMISIWALPIILLPSMKIILSLPMKDQAFSLSFLFVNIRTFPEVIARMIFPFDHPVLPHFTLFLTILGTLLIIALLILIVLRKDFKNRRVILGAAWFTIFIIPGMFISINLKGQLFDYLECRFYLPIIGALMAIPELLPDKLKNLNKKIQMIIIILLLAIFSIFTIAQSTKYQDQLTFWQSAVHSNPKLSAGNLWIASVNKIYKKGLKKADAGDYKGAIEDFNRVIILDTANYRYYETRGFYKLKERDYKGALLDFSRAAGINPNKASAFYQRAFVKMHFEDYNGAITDLNIALRLDPESFLSYYQRAIAKYKVRDFSGSVDDCSYSIRFKPDFSNAYLQRGIVRIELGQTGEACADFQYAARLGSRQAFALMQEYCVK